MAQKLIRKITTEEQQDTILVEGKVSIMFKKNLGNFQMQDSTEEISYFAVVPLDILNSVKHYEIVEEARNKALQFLETRIKKRIATSLV